MNAEIGAEAALFPEKEYINGIAVAVQGIDDPTKNVHRDTFFGDNSSRHPFRLIIHSFTHNTKSVSFLCKKCTDLQPGKPEYSLLSSIV